MYNNIRVKNIDTDIELEFNNIFYDDTIKLITQKIGDKFNIEPFNVFIWYEYNGKKIPITKKINDYKEFDIDDTYTGILLKDNTFTKKEINLIEYLLNYINFIEESNDKKCNILLEDIKINNLYFIEKKNHNILQNLFPDEGSIESLNNIIGEEKTSNILKYIYKNKVEDSSELVLKKKNIVIKSTLTNSFDAYRYFQLNNTSEKRPFIMYKGLIDNESTILIKQYDEFKYTQLYYALQNILLKNDIKDGLYLVHVNNNNLVIIKNRLDRPNAIYYEYVILTIEKSIRDIYNILHKMNCELISEINNTKYVLPNLEKIKIQNIEYDTITVLFTINKRIKNIDTLKTYLLCYDTLLLEKKLKNTQKNIINLVYKRLDKNIEVKVSRNTIDILIENINYNLIGYIKSFIEILIEKYNNDYGTCENVIEQTYDEEEIDDNVSEISDNESETETETESETEQDFEPEQEPEPEPELEQEEELESEPESEQEDDPKPEREQEQEPKQQTINFDDDDFDEDELDELEGLMMGGNKKDDYKNLNYKKIDPVIFDPKSVANFKGNQSFDNYQKKFGAQQPYSRRCQKFKQPAVIENTEENRNKLRNSMNKIDDTDKAKSYLEINNNLYFCPRFWCGETQEPISLNDVKPDPNNNKKWISDKCEGPILDGHDMDSSGKKRSQATGRHIGILKGHDFNNGMVVKCGEEYYATKQDALEDNVKCKDKSKIEENIEQICVPCCFKQQQLNKCDNGKIYNNDLELEQEDNKGVIDKDKVYLKDELNIISEKNYIILLNENNEQVSYKIYTKTSLKEENYDKFKIYNIDDEYKNFYSSTRATDKKDIYLLPKSLSSLINSYYNYNNKTVSKQRELTNNTNEFYGFLPDRINYNLIGIIMIALNIQNKNLIYYTYNLLKNDILDSIKKETFREYYNTNLPFIFDNYERLMIYLKNKSNINKEYDDIIIEYLLNSKIVYYNNNSEKIEKNKLNILLLENNEENIYMICPNYSSKYNPKIKTLVLIKNKDNYSILIKNKKTLHNHNEIIVLIDKMKDCIIRKDNLEYKEYIKNKYKNIVEVYNTERVLLDNINKEEIKEYIYDSLNKIVGVVNKKNVIIPVQPSDNIINIEKSKLLDIKDVKKYYKSIKETYNDYMSIEEYKVKPRSIAVIDDKVIGIRLENGHTIGISPQITLEQYKQLGIPLVESKTKYYKKTQNERSDNRINKINKIEYETETYKRAEVEVANYLNSNLVEKDNLNKILEDEKKSIKEKRQIVSNILKNMFLKFAYESESIDLSDYITTDIRESCINKDINECSNDKHCGVHDGKCKLNIVKNITNIYSKSLLIRIIGNLTDNLIKDKGKRSDILNNVLNIFSGVLPYIVKEYETLIIVKNINEYLEDQKKIL